MTTHNTTRWSWSTGERGTNRVRVFEHHVTGLLYVEFYEPSARGERPRPRRIALGHRDRTTAKAKAEQMAAAFRAGTAPRSAEVTLRELFDIYEREVTPGKAPTTQRHDRTTFELLLRVFGASRPARSLNRRDWDHYIRERRSGRLRAPTREIEAAVGDRIIEQDLRLLLAVLNWATRAGDGRRGLLLERNPLAGLELPAAKNPNRPILTEKEYRDMREHAGDVHSLFAGALVLAHETGHRLGAIIQLRQCA